MKPENFSPNPRLMYGDIVRILGSIAVILIHITASGTATISPSQKEWWLYNGINASCRWCVPVFIMLSGALLLEPKPQDSTRSFYQKRARRVVYPLLFWSAFYVIVNNWGAPPLHLLKQILSSIIFASATYHLYFLYILLGLYFFTPFMWPVISNLSQRHLFFYSAAALLAASGDAFVRSRLGYGLDSFSYFAPFVGYFCLGYVLKYAVLTRSQTFYCLFFLALSLAFTLILKFAASHGPRLQSLGSFAYDFLSPGVIIMSVCIFLLFSKIASRCQLHSIFNSQIVRSTSGLTFGIYLIHPFFLSLIWKNNIMNRLGSGLFYIICSLLVSFTFSLILTKIIQSIKPIRILVG